MDGDQLVFGDMGRTLMGCPGLRDQIEDAVYTTLQDRVDWKVDGSTLVISRPGARLVYVSRG